MKLTSSQMKYMMALWRLDHGDKIRCTDVARELCVKKPSVCGMLCRLENMGLITQDPYSDIRITEDGRQVMEECGRKVALLKGLLKKRLEVPENTAEEMAYLLLGSLEKQILEEIMAGESAQGLPGKKI